MTGIKKITYDFQNLTFKKIEIEMKKLPKEEPITEEVMKNKEKVKVKVVVVSEKQKKKKLKKLRETIKN